MSAAIEREIGDLIRNNGRITFAQFMQVCLYSPRGGFYSTRRNEISAHFGTSATSHPVFGALLARQLEQMWRRLEEPRVFHVIEVGAGDGALARSIADAAQQMAPEFARALYYVAADYAPGSHESPDTTTTPENRAGHQNSTTSPDRDIGVQWITTEGLRAFRSVVGCIVSNELIDNFPVHRFAICDGRVQEVFLTLYGGELTEVLDEPSTHRIAERLKGLGVSLPEGHRGEVNLAMEDWSAEVARVLDRGFVLTIDYGELFDDLYGAQNAGGTLVCHRQHVVSDDPYQHMGEQDITCQVDFTSLMRAGERHGLDTVGYLPQSRFLENLGFSSYLDALPNQGLTAARTEFNRVAMMTLVDPDEYGDLKVLAQAKGVGAGVELTGFAGDGNDPLD